MDILVVEDDADFLDSLLDYLAELGHDAAGVLNGRAALARRPSAGVALVDLNLNSSPTGLEVASELRSRGMRVVCMTAASLSNGEREVAGFPLWNKVSGIEKLVEMLR